MRPHRAAVRGAAVVLAAICAALALGACGNTVQEEPIPHNLLEDLIEAPFPVYWLGARFDGLAVSEVSHDGAGAYTLAYGDCLSGGQGNCVPPLRIVTSPDNSFVPGGSAAARTVPIRGAWAVVAETGRAILIPTAGVMLDIYAHTSQLARAAAETAVPINEPAAPEAPLPARLPDTGFAASPLPLQVPNPLRPAS